MSDPNKHAAPYVPTEEQSAAIKQQMNDIADRVQSSVADPFPALSTEQLLVTIKKMSAEKDVLTLQIAAAKKAVQRRVGAM